QTIAAMERKAAVALRREGFPTGKQKHERSLALRYKGQSFELDVKQTRGDLVAGFHRAHRERYGYAQESSAVEIVSARVRSSGLVERPAETRARISVKKNHAKPSKILNAYVDGEKLD